MRLIRQKQTYVFPMFVLATLIVQTLVMFGLLIQLGLWARINKRPVPSLVQLVDGRAIRVGPSDHLNRNPDVIRNFVNETMTLMFSWSGTLPPDKVEDFNTPKTDPGVEASESGLKSGRIATTSWEAGFALAEKFRKPFLETIATMTPSTVFESQKGTQATLVIRTVSFPEEIEPAKWKVKLVSNLVIVSSQDKLGTPIPFNKEIYVAAVDPPTQPLESGSSSLQKVVYRMRQAGLEIYSIRDLSTEK
jgi:hypothetical protein